VLTGIGCGVTGVADVPEGYLETDETSSEIFY
jgi:hypothetical protein